jgi:hypothetical protein
MTDYPRNAAHWRNGLEPVVGPSGAASEVRAAGLEADDFLGGLDEVIETGGATGLDLRADPAGPDARVFGHAVVEEAMNRPTGDQI